MSRPRRFSLFVIALLALVVPVLAQNTTASHDAQIKSEIERKIAGLKRDSSHVVVTVHDDTVMLEGAVPTLWVKRRVIEAARKATGVTKVDSTLEIARSETDAQLAAALTRALQQYPRMTVYDYVNGGVRDGIVTVKGVVTDPSKSSEIIESLEKIRGVQDINDNIRTLPVSPQDDRIRVTIANEIYSNSLFENYSLANPPIHVIVEYGHVTLVGIVASDIERRKAVTIARGVSGVFSVDDQIRLPSELPR